ncbi:MAG: hypothetical protein ABI718_01880 [Acidobacteriota bacterium]
MRHVATILLTPFFSSSLLASDAYVLRFNLPGAPLDICTQVIWADQLVFHNGGPLAEVVRLVGTSYPLPPSFAPRQFTLAPGQTVSLAGAVGADWEPPAPFIGVAHLDLPQDVAVLSRQLVQVLHGREGCPLLSPTYVSGQGAVPQPVYAKLTERGSPQIHPGADLPGIDARTNVTVYNGGEEPAAVSIELRQSCDDVLVETRKLIVAPNSVASAYGLRSAPFTCDGTAPDPQPVLYVRVISDQPSLSWVSTLANDVALPRVNITATP